MSRSLRLFVDLCLFRAKPQDLPGSQTLVLITAVLAMLTYALTDQVHDQIGTIVTVATVQVIVFGVVIWIALKIRRMPERWNQTISALYGTGSLLQLVGWPVSSWFEQVRSTPEQATMPVLLVFALGVWFLAIMANVTRHAMEVSIGKGLVISFVCQAVTVVTLIILFGPIGKAT